MLSEVFHGARKKSVAHLCVAVAVLCAWPTRPAEFAGAGRGGAARPRPSISAAEVDAALGRAALAALAGREGAVVVLDARTGRVRAAVNPQLASESAFPPGSAVKPFTLLAALRSGLVRADSRLHCRKHFRRADADFTCAHPVFRPPLDPEHALAHSCNFFFARLGERLDTSILKQTLAAHGLTTPPGGDHAPPPATAQQHALQTGAPRSPAQTATLHATARATTARHSSSRTTTRRAAAQATGAHARWDTSTALGEGGAFVVTPLRLVAAYAALFNGGRLHEPRQSPPENFRALETARVRVSVEERALLVAGMRGAIRYGTAEAAELDELPLPVFGKTGTATELGGFRTHGWFVGFAADGQERPPAPHADQDRISEQADQDRISGHADQDQASESDAFRNRVSVTGGDGDRPSRAELAASLTAKSGAGGERTAERSAREAFLHDRLAPRRIRLGVVVFLKRGQGKQAAAAARAIFAEYARLVAEGAAEDSRPDTAGDSGAISDSGTSRDSGTAYTSSVGSHADALAPRSSSDASQYSASLSLARRRGREGGGLAVGVRPARDAAVLVLPLEEYLFGVLAAEASTEDEFAALKAQAVVSRTYALRHLGRHAREGFDFCATTHCQRFLRVTRSNARPDFHRMLRDALAETAGESLRGAGGRLADGYFSASCGGMTANVESLWGVPAREQFERGVRDEACAETRYSRWTDAVPARQLLTALREDPRTDVGSRLTDVRVVRRDRTGRAELVEVTGDRRRVLRGWDFKIIVGRTLGWSLVKSSRFTVERAGASFVFRGSGFGHGLGLCQQGAHVLARRGADYRRILAHYFPGASVARLDDPPRGEDGSTRGGFNPGGPARGEAGSASGWMPDASSPLFDATTTNVLDVPAANFSDPTTANFFDATTANLFNSTAGSRFDSATASVFNATTANLFNGTPMNAAGRAGRASLAAQSRVTLSSENFRASFAARSAANERRDVEAALAALEAARRDLLGRLAAASLPAPGGPRAEINFNETTADFVAATGQPAWAAAATRGRRVELQPLALLRRRGVVNQTLRHELAHLVLEALSRGRAPRWLTEGLAAHFAGEGAMLARHAPRERPPLAELERRLAAPASPAEMRALYAAAHREVIALIRAEGEPAAWRHAAQR